MSTSDNSAELNRQIQELRLKALAIAPFLDLAKREVENARSHFAVAEGTEFISKAEADEYFNQLLMSLSGEIQGFSGMPSHIDRIKF